MSGHPLITLLALVIFFPKVFAVQSLGSCRAVFAAGHFQLRIDPVKHAEIMGVLFIDGKVLEKTGQRVRTSHFQELWASVEFSAFLERKGLRREQFSNDDDRWKIVGQYVHLVMSSYKDRIRWAELENEERRDRLRRHGLDGKNENSWETLKTASRKNVKRLLERLGDNSAIKIPEMDEAEVRDLEIFFTHNSSKMTQAPGYPILSPKELSKMGLKRYGYSNTDFHEMIGSVAHIYGYIRFRHRGQIAREASEYGRNGFTLRDQYMREHAMVSAWVMWPKDLRKVLPFLDPQFSWFGNEGYPERMRQLDRAARYVESEGPLAPSEAERLSRELAPQLRNLHQLDFTPTDFEHLIHELLLHRLRHLYPTNRTAYHELLTSLSSRQIHPIEKAIFGDHLNVGVIKEFYIPVGFEGTVPVAIPETELEFF